MKIVITGSEGSLMQSVIPKLLSHGHEVVGIDNLSKYGTAKGNGYQFFQVDLINRDDCIKLFQGADYVIHAAAKLYGVGGFNKYCADILSDDTAVTGNVLHACVKNKVKKIVYISSSMVYETSIQQVGIPVTENLTEKCVVPQTDYGLSKLVGERLCWSFYKQYGLDYTIWRPFNVINPLETSTQEQGYSHVFADFVKHLVVERKCTLPIIGDGNQIRCFTYIDDTAHIIANYSFDTKTINQEFNICNVEPVTMRELAQKIYKQACQTNDKLTFETVSDYKNDVLVRIPDVTKLLTLIGEYKFKSLDYSITQCLQFYR